jgi:phage terminase large subunit-like protein
MSPAGYGYATKHVLDESQPPWKTDPSWKRLRRAAKAIRFIETYCRAPKGEGHGQPLKLADFQKKFIKAILADGVRTAALQTPRGNGKSSLGGALAVWALFDDDETGAPQVPIVATTIGQAILSCYGVAVSMVKAEPELRKRALIFTGISTPRITTPFNEGELFPKANDPDGLQGLDPSLAIVDEIGFQPLESWNSLRLASGKRSRSLIVGLGTPGFDHDNALYHLRKRQMEGEKSPGLVFREYSAPNECSITDRGAWYVANPALKAGFLSLDALASEVGSMLEGHFRTFRLGQWFEGVDSWLGTNGKVLWDALYSPAVPVAGAATWVGVDVGIKRDSTAVVMVQRRPDGFLHAWSRVWMPADDAPVDVTDVMFHLRSLAETYTVEAISYDPRFFDVPAKMLQDEGLAIVEIPQSVERMTVICGSLLEIIKRAELRHSGDQSLTEHVLNAVPRYGPNGFTLQKAKSRGHIDACIALALAVDRALHTEPARDWEPIFAWA